MELYMWRLNRIGFTKDRAYEVVKSFKADVEALDRYITELEDF